MRTPQPWPKRNHLYIGLHSHTDAFNVQLSPVYFSVLIFCPLQAGARTSEKMCCKCSKIFTPFRGLNDFYPREAVRIKALLAVVTCPFVRHTQAFVSKRLNLSYPLGRRHWSLSFTHKLSRVSKSLTALFGMRHLTYGTNFLHFFAFFVSRPPRSAFLHCQAPTLLLNRWLACLTGSSILVLKLTFSPDPFPHNFPLCNGLISRFLSRTWTEVSGVENIGQCGRLSQLRWLLGAL